MVSKSRAGFAGGLLLGALLSGAVVYGLWPRAEKPPAPAEPAVGERVPPAPVSDPASLTTVERITAQEVRQLLERGAAVVIDVRDVDNFKAGHIPGALQIPLEYVQGEIPWFPRDKKLITYCT